MSAGIYGYLVVLFALLIGCGSYASMLVEVLNNPNSTAWVTGIATGLVAEIADRTSITQRCYAVPCLGCACVAPCFFFSPVIRSVDPHFVRRIGNCYAHAGCNCELRHISSLRMRRSSSG